MKAIIELSSDESDTTLPESIRAKPIRRSARLLHIATPSSDETPAIASGN